MIDRGENVLVEHSKNRLLFDSEQKQINLFDRRFYRRSDKVYYPSVTTILQYLPKAKFFETWLKEVGFNADIILRRASEEGTQVHNAVERLVKGETVEWLDDYGNAKYSLTVWECILKFYEFWTTHKPELLLVEKFVYSDINKYAGTTDLLVKLQEEVWLLDIKTSNQLHRAYDLQTAAYAKAVKEMLDIDVQRTGILWLKSTKRKPSDKKGVYQGKGWELKPVDAIDENFELFKLVHKLYLLDNEDKDPSVENYPISLSL